jgi:hypothetical protein
MMEMMRMGRSISIAATREKPSGRKILSGR